ncbi:SDR family NAD(P)-dependent oxidoreductase, partial [Chloroflexota bacterium]
PSSEAILMMLPCRRLAIRADVSRKDDVEGMAREVVSELGDIDILINNAGITALGSLLETDEATWDSVIDTNLKGCYLCSQAVGRMMAKRRQGNIISIASELGFKSVPARSAYCISKAGVIMLTKVLARDLGGYNIRVNAIAPGVFKTALTESFFSDPEAMKDSLARQVMGRFANTDDFIGVALFLASDAASFITGHTIAVEGGNLT